MPFQDRKGADAERKFEDVHKQFGMENLTNTKILTVEPATNQIPEGQMRLLKTGGNLYLIVKHNGVLVRRVFTTSGDDPTTPTNLVETGTIQMWAGTIAAIPSGYLHCDGSSVSRTTYAALFSKIGTIHGTGDGSTTFNLPDLRDRSIMGARQDDAGVPKSNVTGSLTQTGGAATHTLVAAEMPSHTHTGPSHTHTVPDHSHTVTIPTKKQVLSDFSAGSQDWVVDDNASGNPTESATSSSVTGVTTGAAGTGATGSAGSGTAHNNLHPYYVLTFIVKT